MNLATNKKINLAYIILISLAGMLLFSWITFGQNSLLELHKMQKDRERYLKIISELKEKNRRLSDEIRRIKEDPEYLKAIARKELGLIKKNEVVYRFQKEDQGVEHKRDDNQN